MSEKMDLASVESNAKVLANSFDDGIISAISMADSFVRKQYLTELKDAQVVPISSQAAQIMVGKNVRMFKIMSISYCEADDIYSKITNLYNAVSEFNASQILLLDSDGYKISFYLGISCNELDKLSMQFNTFESSFLGNFPGGRIEKMSITQNEELFGSIFDEPNIKISSVSALTTAKEASGDRIYGIEHLVNGMYGKPFTMLLISDAVSKDEIRRQRQSLEAMYTELSAFREYTVSMNKSESEGRTQSFNFTKSESVTEGKSVTDSTTFGKSKNKSSTVSDNEEMQRKNAKNQLAGTALSLAAIISGFGAPVINGVVQTMNPLQGLFYGGSLSNVIGSAQTLISGADASRTETTGEGENYSISFSEAETTSQQKGFSASKGISDSSTDTVGRSVQLQYENKSIMELLKVLSARIERMQHIESRGGFDCAAYFVTGDNSTALTVANMYRSLLGRGNSLGQNNAINVWSEPNMVTGLCEYLKRMEHPLFHFEKKPGYPTFTASSLVAVDEFPMYASLPRKSLNGLPVALRAEFARDIISTSDDDSDRIEIGNIFHMGKTEVNKVFISKNDLSGHMFVCGSTGMGKSNFCYGLIDALHKKDVRFMVIEPAKGEYRHVFGGCEDVLTFGTNPNLAPLLKINPFSFPKGIHVNEHISRLLEIFNSCWPMYAAMPEVMKEGIETIYKRCGYDLITGRLYGQSGRDTKRKFPTFADLLNILPDIIKSSEFSGEVKGNYIGSLVTRVKSLTDGLYGCIFTENEIDNRTLFEENVLVDLSRVGSGEMKALIMGVMVMKLQEYRMCTAEMNTPLSHVTVLEEAHHLLKSNTSSSAEGVNLRAMSLEMITNAIAEMRTYGEGFIIADQSPAMMDLSVIRNTNTKVVFKLPENSDRVAVGSAMSLSDVRINELSRLERGVAAIYQSNWDNAVLSKIRYFDSWNFKPYIYDAPPEQASSREVCSQLLAILLRGRLSEEEESSLDAGFCDKLLSNSTYAGGDLEEYLALIRRYMQNDGCEFSFAQICRYIDRMVHSRKLLHECGSMEQLAQWDARARAYINKIVDLTEDEMTELIIICINIQVSRNVELRKMYFRYFAYCRRTKKGKDKAQ